MLLTELKMDLANARKYKENVAADILRVLIGEIELQQSRSKSGKDLSDDQILNIIKKLIKSNEETISAGFSNADKLVEENEVLSCYLPKKMSKYELYLFLGHLAPEIKLSKINGTPVGPFMGKCIKELKNCVKDFDIDHVKDFIEEI